MRDEKILEIYQKKAATTTTITEQHKIYIFMEISHHRRRRRIRKIFSSHFFFLAKKKSFNFIIKKIFKCNFVCDSSHRHKFIDYDIYDEYLSRNYLTSCGNGRMDPRSNKILMISARIKEREEAWKLDKFENALKRFKAPLLTVIISMSGKT